MDGRELSAAIENLNKGLDATLEEGVFAVADLIVRLEQYDRKRCDEAGSMVEYIRGIYGEIGCAEAAAEWTKSEAAKEFSLTAVSYGEIYTQLYRAVERLEILMENGGEATAEDERITQVFSKATPEQSATMAFERMRKKVEEYVGARDEAMTLEIAAGIIEDAYSLWLDGTVKAAPEGKTTGYLM